MEYEMIKLTPEIKKLIESTVKYKSKYFHSYRLLVYSWEGFYDAQEEVTRHKRIEGKNNISSQFSKICGEAES